MNIADRTQAVLDALNQVLTYETCGGCTYRPRLILDAREKLTGAWLCPMIGRITIDDAPACSRYEVDNASARAD